MRDFCSYAPDFLFGYPVWKACQQHDRDYKNQIGRKEADKNFLFNLKIILPKKLHLFAYVYYLAVRALGWLHY